MASAAGELVSRCFEARTAAHKIHLTTRSYAQHKALNDFYEGIVPLADDFAEAYQGVYGLIENFGDNEDVEDATAAIPLLKALRSWLVANTDKCSRGQGELENIIFEIVQLIDSTLYKMRFLS